MNISAPFIARPRGTSLLALGAVLAGLLAYTQLPVSPLPRFEMPTINVSAKLPGASAETMASAVAMPLERRFGRIAGLNEMTSQSVLGASSITLQFDLSHSVDALARDVQAAINAAAVDLPSNLPQQPIYRKINPADAPIMVLALKSDSHDIGQLYDYANSELALRLGKLQGVGQVMAAGGQQPAIRVHPDVLKLQAAGATLEDVRNALTMANVASPLGILQNLHRLTFININDQLEQIGDYQHLAIRQNGPEQLRLQDVARVFPSVEDDQTIAWFDLHRAILLVIRREPDANVIATIARIHEAIPSLRAELPAGMHLDVGVDRSETIRASIRDIEISLLLAVLLVWLVVLLFLRSLRATLIPAVSVPLSLCLTFAAMYVLGFSLNNLTLMAMTISTGFVVDDAIVVVENIMRWREKKIDRLTSALKGSEQIGFTVLSMTVSLAVVFLPLMLMPGILGRLLYEFGATLLIAILASGLVSLTVTPMMAAVLLPDGIELVASRGMAAWLESSFMRLERGYEWILQGCLRRRVWMWLVMVLSVVLTMVGFVYSRKGLFPEQDTGLIMGFSQAGQEVSFEKMKTYQHALTTSVNAHPAVLHTVSFTGAGGNGASTTNQGTFFITLKPRHQRRQTVFEIIDDLRQDLKKLPGVQGFMLAAQDLRAGGRSTKTQYQYTLQAIELKVLRKHAPRVLKAMQALPQLTDVASDVQNRGLEMAVTIARDDAARFNTLPQTIDNVLYDAYGQRQVSTLYTERSEYRVILEAPPWMQTPEHLPSLMLPTGSLYNPVYLKDIAKVQPGHVALVVNHQSQMPAVTISFNLAKNVSLGEAVVAIHDTIDGLRLPSSVQTSFEGTAKAFKEGASSQILLMVAALFTVYIVLGMLYESFVHPLTILSTLPSASLGALLALWLSGLPFDLIGMVGIILLIGIVKKNAIMMVDVALVLQREQRLPASTAIAEACVLRFRPITMTTMAAFLGALPMVFAHGTGSEMRLPLGVTIAGGLLLSQLTTLLTTPVVYLGLEWLRCRLRRAAGWA